MSSETHSDDPEKVAGPSGSRMLVTQIHEAKPVSVTGAIWDEYDQYEVFTCSKPNLLTLPVELRLRILSYLLRSSTPLCLDTVSQDKEPEDSDSRDRDRDDEVRWVQGWDLSSQILAVCRQLHDEGTPILYDNEVCLHFCQRSVTILDIHLAEEVMTNLFSDIDHDESVPRAVRQRTDNTEISPCRCSSLKDHIHNRMAALKRFRRMVCTLEGGAPPQNTKACLILRAAGAHQYDHITIKNNFSNRTANNRPTRWYSGPVWLRYLRCNRLKFEGTYPDPPWANSMTEILKSPVPSPNMLQLFLSMQDVTDNVLDEGFDALVDVLGKNNWKAVEGREMNYLYQADGEQYDVESTLTLDRAEEKLKQQLARVERARRAVDELYT